MKTKHIIVFLLFSQWHMAAQAQVFTTAQYRQDFDYFRETVNNEYCYFNKKKTDWQKLSRLYGPAIDSITARDQFVTLLEKSLTEIYDHHANLNTNTSLSPRMVPSGTDTWAEYINGKPVITELRKGFGAAGCGMMPGMEVIAVNDIPVAVAIQGVLPKTADHIDEEAKNYALRVLLAGDHIKARKFTLKYNGKANDYYPDKEGLQLENIHYDSKLETKTIGGTGYIRINDCLYDDGLIGVFDSAMQQMKSTGSLILDLRNTASGGNTSVARAIIGWFINSEHFYQKHEYYAEEKANGIKRSWEEIVSPRPGKYYSKPLVILCDHWTGSMGEGITIAFDALQRPATKTIGTNMARLNGAVNTFEMPNTKIHFSIPVERVYHINGQPREQYVPGIFVDMQKEKETNGKDIILERAIQYLNKR